MAYGREWGKETPKQANGELRVKKRVRSCELRVVS